MCLARARKVVIRVDHMTDKRLVETVPVRVSRRQKIALRRWARLAKVDVSDVVRDMIEERLRRQADESGASASADAGADAGSDLSDVAA